MDNVHLTAGYAERHIMTYTHSERLANDRRANDRKTEKQKM